MIAHKKEFFGGLLLFIIFWVIFSLGMSPLFDGRNILGYMDNLYNTISKNSAYYVPAVRNKTASFLGKPVLVTIVAGDDERTRKFSGLLEKTGARVTIEDHKINIATDLGLFLNGIVSDADRMYANDGRAISAKYGYNEKQVTYDLWHVLKAMEKDLNRQQKFQEAKIVNLVVARTIEPAYNYYGIKAKSISDKLGIVIISLTGYVIYTLWFGFSILFMFEGWGLKLEH